MTKIQNKVSDIQSPVFLILVCDFLILDLKIVSYFVFRASSFIILAGFQQQTGSWRLAGGGLHSPVISV